MKDSCERQDENSRQPTGQFRAVAYYRHSTQDRQGISVSTQRDQVRAWVETLGGEIIHESIDPGRQRKA
jgi:hypothetical protein